MTILRNVHAFQETQRFILFEELSHILSSYGISLDFLCCLV